MSSNPITATEVPESKRLAFLPRLFGRHMLQAEQLTYRWLSCLSDEYHGGYWQFYELSNGGGYMAPTSPHQLQLRVEGNGFSGTLTAEAAGIVACLFTLCELAASLSTQADRIRMAELYHALRDYAGEHPQRRHIFSAID